MKVLLTGFEAFLGMDSNPTEHIATKLNGQFIHGREVIGKVLPVDFYQSKDTLISYINTYKPDTIISLGLAVGRNRITPERVSINCMDGEPDNVGHIYTDQKIATNGPAAYFSTLPIRKITETLQEQSIPAEISNTAGTYLCNQIMYTSRHYIETNQLQTIAGFIHIPAHHQLALNKPSLPSWSLNELIEAIEIIIGI